VPGSDIEYLVQLELIETGVVRVQVGLLRNRYTHIPVAVVIEVAVQLHVEVQVFVSLLALGISSLLLLSDVSLAQTLVLLSRDFIQFIQFIRFPKFSQLRATIGPFEPIFRLIRKLPMEVGNGFFRGEYELDPLLFLTFGADVC